MAYFDKLNYTLSNEDTRIEYQLLEENSNSVFSISGSGARVLPLLAKNPKELLVVDLSIEQLYLCELRIAAAKSLSYEEFLFFLGYRGALYDGEETGDDRIRLFNQLDLSESCKQFWNENSVAWASRGFILLGKWEGHFQKLGKIFRNYLRFDMRPIFEAQSLEEQIELYEKNFNATLFKTFLTLVANEYVFNKFLYKGHFSGGKKHKTESRAPYQFLDDEFRRLFTNSLVRKNYFLQVLFLGKIYFEEGLPLEASFNLFQNIKKSKSKVTYLQQDLASALQSRKFDFISLSDTISYLPEEVASQLLQTIDSNTHKDTQMIIRSFLRAPTEMNTNGWLALEDKNKWAQNLDGTGVYQFHIYKKL